MLELRTRSQLTDDQSPHLRDVEHDALVDDLRVIELLYQLPGLLNDFELLVERPRRVVTHKFRNAMLAMPVPVDVLSIAHDFERALAHNALEVDPSSLSIVCPHDFFHVRRSLAWRGSLAWRDVLAIS